MKVHPNRDASCIFDLIVGATDTVESLKKRITDIQPVPYPDAKITFHNQVLTSGQNLSECEVREGDILDFTVQASAQVLVENLIKLLEGHALSVQELGFLFCHKHGVNISQALKYLSKDESLSNFLKEQKAFVLENGLVTLSPNLTSSRKNELQTTLEKADSTPAHSTSTAFAVQVVARTNASFKLDGEDQVDIKVDASDSVMSLKSRAAEALQIPCPDVEIMLQDKLLHDHQILSTCGVKEGSSLCITASMSEEVFAQQLVELLQAKPSQTSCFDELALLYCSKYGCNVARVLKAFGKREKLKEFVLRNQSFVVEGGCVKLSNHVTYADIAVKKVSRSAQVAQVIDCVISAMSFLNIHCVEARNVACDTEDTTVTVFLAGLPLTSESTCLPVLVQSVKGVLEERLGGHQMVKSVCAENGVVRVSAQDSITVFFLFSAAC